MAFCSHCGIEIEPNHASCPLCHAALTNDPAAAPGPRQAFANQREDLRPSQAQIRGKRGLIMTICSFCLAIPGLICFSTDQLYGGGGWSGIVLLALGLVWVLVFIALFSMQHGLIGILSMLSAVAAFLFCLDLQTGNQGWGLGLGLPVTACCALACLAIWVCWYALRRKVTFLVSGVLLSIGGLCLGIDLCIHWYRQGAAALGWSLIVLVALVPIALCSWVLGVAYRRSPRLQRFLHW